MSRPASVSVFLRNTSIASKMPIAAARLALHQDAPAGDQCKCGGVLVVNETSSPRRVAHSEPACRAFVRVATSIGKVVAS